MGDQNADLKHRLPDISPAMGGFTQDQQRIVIQVLQRGKPCMCSHGAREGVHLCRGTEEVQRAPVNSLWFALAESLPGKEMVLSSPCWTLLPKHTRAPPSALLSLFGEGFSLLLLFSFSFLSFLCFI